MVSNKSYLLLSVLCCCRCVYSDLNLSENDNCITQSKNGTCVELTNCPSALLHYLYQEAGYDPEEYDFPEFPEICSNQGETPVVCCTDCKIGRSKISDSYVTTYGRLVDKTGPVAWKSDTCHTHGHNGTCVELFKCDSAALTHLLEEAGYDGKTYEFPELPDVCSYKGDKPIVCCTDCLTGNDAFRNKVIAPMAIIKDKKPSVAWRKCYDYFKRLPYSCRGFANVYVRRGFDMTQQCHMLEYGGALGVGGRDAEKWEFPHMALLGYGDTAESADWLCGGSVISERFILTAAHCSSTHALGSIKFAALGLLKRTDPKENWKIYNIKRIILHPEYKSPSKYHDIALLETETEINFGKDLLPACLDITDNDWLYQDDAEAAGWGRLGHNKGLADTLQVVLLDRFNETRCAEMYPPHRHLKRGYDHKTQMCYGSYDAIIDTCDGDSGGPLQKNEFKCLYHVVGVTSYGRDCGVLGNAGMYTRVSYYVPWIESIVWPGETISD